MEKVDLKKKLKHLYNPSPKEISLVDVPQMNFVMIDGSGDPNKAQEYQEAINKLQNDIRSKADGFVDGNSKNDWIVDPTAQGEICVMIDNLIYYLRSLY